MKRVLCYGMAALLVLPISAASAEVRVSMEVRKSDLTLVTGPVAVGSELTVSIYLVADEADAPVADVRGITLDFAATEAGIDLGTFLWQLDAGAYGLQIPTLPTPSVISLLFGSDPRLVVLDADPVLIATIDVTANSTGVLNAVGALGVGQVSRARVDAGFDSPQLVFTVAGGNLTGGTTTISVSDAPPPPPPPPNPDRDGDGVVNELDAFPDDPTESVDTDGDGIGDNADTDDDDDGVLDVDDAFPLDPNEAGDRDADGVGDQADLFPDDPNESRDTNGNGIGDNADPDDDGDGVDDVDDAFPDDPTESADRNGNGIGDNAEQNSNTGPRAGGRLCGVAMLGTSMLIGLGLCLLGVAPHRRSRARHRGAVHLVLQR